MKKYKKILLVLSWIIGIIFLIRVCIDAIPCVLEDQCILRPYIFWRIPSSVWALLILSVIGAFLISFNIHYTEKKDKTKRLCEYFINALFLIMSLSIFNKYLYPIIERMIIDQNFFETYRISILLAGIFIIISFWYGRDKLKGIITFVFKN